MKINRRAQLQLTTVGIAGLLLLSLVRVEGVGSQTATENSLRELDAQWAAAAKARDVEKTVSYYSEDAIVMPPNAAALTTKEAIRSAWKEMLETPGVSLTWKLTKVEVAKSGELAYITGTYEETGTGADGKPMSDHGKYLEVMKKQADGSWKCVADIWNSDVAAPAPEEKM